jgi:glycosyltransferase involved in cell wall biosynthesis
VPVRTVWNGIDFAPLARTPGREAAARALRHKLGIGLEAFVLLALANPRPQKRLHLLPGILAATEAELKRRGIPRRLHLLLAGETSRLSAVASRCVTEVEAEIDRLNLGEQVRWLGAVEQVAPVLAAADVLVSTSAHEGLSLAQLEALAAGLPVVATAVGGAPELAQGNPAVALLPPDAGPQRFAEVIAELTVRPPLPAGAGEFPGKVAAARHFTRARMAERHTWLYPRTLAALRPERGNGLWLVTNNFSMGGAQSSARRLLLGLAAEGVRVRAAVLQEQLDYPTPGRRTLLEAGIPVLALPPAGSIDAARAVAALLAAMDADPPQAVLLWNALATYKVLLVDGLLKVPVYDVSPGEMYFTALEAYFARPRSGLPYLSAADYGARLAGVVVKYQAEASRAALLGAPVHVIPNGVPIDLDPPGAQGERDRLILGTAVRISPQKKLEELLQALRLAHPRLPPYVLRVAGGVECGAEAHAEELRQQARGLCVEWVGEFQEVRPFLRELDLFVLVSEPAGCPNASLEALAAGRPVILTDVGGAAEQVEDNVSGRLIPAGAPAALAEALVELAHDPAARAAWGAAGRARVAARFSLPQMVAAYRRLCLGSTT